MGVVTMFTLMSRLRRMSIAPSSSKPGVQVVLLRHLAQIAVGEHDALEILHVLVGVTFATRSLRQRLRARRLVDFHQRGRGVHVRQRDREQDREHRDGNGDAEQQRLAAGDRVEVTR